MTAEMKRWSGRRGLSSQVPTPELNSVIARVRLTDPLGGGTVATTLPNDATDLVVDSNGVQLAVHDFGGSGAGIILLHGLGRSLLDWQLVAPLLTGDHHVVAFDLRCHGRSGDGPWSWADALGDVGVVAEHLQLVNPAIAGHSLGGMLAVMWGAGHPDSPKSL